MHPIVHELLGWLDDVIEIAVDHEVVPAVRETQGLLTYLLDAGIVDAPARVDPPNSVFQLCTCNYIELAHFCRIADNVAVTVDQPEH